ncbi:MAG: hypothetical protein ACTSRA_12385 [Promethearchaeota archaeon]
MTPTDKPLLAVRGMGIAIPDLESRRHIKKQFDKEIRVIMYNETIK